MRFVNKKISGENGMKEVVIDGIIYVEKKQYAVNGDKGRYCIVRCKNAGVHAGFVRKRKNGVLLLLDSRRLWKWWSKFSLSGLATDGVLDGKEDDCMFACVLPELELTESDVCEVIPCTEKAKISILSIKEYKNE